MSQPYGSCLRTTFVSAAVTSRNYQTCWRPRHNRLQFSSQRKLPPLTLRFEPPKGFTQYVAACERGDIHKPMVRPLSPAIVGATLTQDCPAPKFGAPRSFLIRPEYFAFFLRVGHLDPAAHAFVSGVAGQLDPPDRPWAPWGRGRCFDPVAGGASSPPQPLSRHPSHGAP